MIAPCFPNSKIVKAAGRAACILTLCLMPALQANAQTSNDQQSTSAAAGDTAKPPKADAQMQKVLDAMAASGAKPIETLTPEEARKQPTPANAVAAVMEKEGITTDSLPESKVKTQDRTIPGPAGEIPVRVYTPPTGEAPFPVLVYYHGGGWVIANLDVYDSSPRALALAAKCVVVSVHYRQAPEHKFPAAVEDAYAAYEWVLKNAKEVGGAPEKVSVAGESAGGNLATVVSMIAREKNAQLPKHQLLVYPVTQYGDFDTESYKENAQAKPLNKAMMQWFWKHYLSSPAVGEKPHASPLKAETSALKGLPPATVILAEIDPLRSEGEAYAKKLKEAGVDVTVKSYDGVVHEFFGMGAVVDKAKEAVKAAAEGLKTSKQGAKSSD